MKALLLVFAVLGLSACGAGSHTVLPPVPVGGPAITDQDDGRTISVHVGDEIQVVLHKQAGFNTWGQPQSSNPAILAAVVDTKGTAVRGVTVARFRAMANGQADVTAYTGVECAPNAACITVVRIWKVTVQVA